MEWGKVREGSLANELKRDGQQFLVLVCVCVLQVTLAYKKYSAMYV